MRIKKDQYKLANFSTFGLNCSTIILGMIYILFPLSELYILWHIHGIITFASWISNLLLVLLNDQLLEKSNPISRKLDFLGNIFLILMIIGTLLIFVSISIEILDPERYSSGIMLIQIRFLAYLGFYSFPIFGLFLIITDIKHLNYREMWTFE